MEPIQLILLKIIKTLIINDLPNQRTREFPTKGNPNTISEQSITYSFQTSSKDINYLKVFEKEKIVLMKILIILWIFLWEVIMMKSMIQILNM